MNELEFVTIKPQKPALQPEEEREIIAMAKKDPKSFRSLYETYYPEIFRFIFKKTNNKSLTADLSAQVFVNALSNLKKYEYRGFPFSSWLYRIASNICMEYFRRNKKQRYVFLNDDATEQLNNDIEPFQYATEEDYDSLKTALQQLNERDMMLIELRYYEEMSFREIGEIFKMTENNAKVRLYRALDKLKKIIKK